MRIPILALTLALGACATAARPASAPRAEAPTTRLDSLVLASLDFLGFGLPPGSPSLGEMVAQGKNNLGAPWLAFTAFVVLGGILVLLVFIGEAVRDSFDPRKMPA